MKERIILHADINYCYAQIEEMRYPELKRVPMAVGGNQEKRHGVILAKNELAKKYQIKTGESLVEAKKKCPGLLVIQPDFHAYHYYTECVKNIYREYTDQVESFGMDEAWLDISSSTQLFGSGYAIAKTIQDRVLAELGLTISIGVSFNKIFAKLGSDLIKPKGLVHISKDNFKEIVWPLAVSELLYVGNATKQKLTAEGITTIGELAASDLSFLCRKLGKMGEVIWQFANGYDLSEVAFSDHKEEVKSVGNSITTIRDVTQYEEAKLVYYVLVESVASRLKDQGLKGSVISISLRDAQLNWLTRQRKIKRSTNITEEIMPVVLDLLVQHWSFLTPLRSIGVTVSQLNSDSQAEQLNLFEDETNHQKRLIVDRTMDQIRTKHGFQAIQRCCLLLDQQLTDFNPKGDHTVHPAGISNVV